jgi:hypothetical protein
MCSYGANLSAAHSDVVLGFQIYIVGNTRHSLEKDIHASGAIRTRNPSTREAADLSRRPTTKRNVRDVFNSKIYDSILTFFLFTSLNQNESVSTIQKPNQCATKSKVRPITDPEGPEGE